MMMRKRSPMMMTKMSSDVVDKNWQAASSLVFAKRRKSLMMMICY